MEKEPTTRPKSPKTPKNTLSMASHVSGNNNIARSKSPKSQTNNNSAPRPKSSNNNSNLKDGGGILQNNPSRSKSPVPRGSTPQDRSKLAREKFQSLLVSASKVADLQKDFIYKEATVTATGGDGVEGATPTSPSKPNIVSATSGSVVAQKSRSRTATPNQDGTTTPPPLPPTASTVTTAPPTKTAPVTSVTPATRSTMESTHTATTAPTKPVNHGRITTTIVSSMVQPSVRSTIATSAKSYPQRYNQFPNIDPRTFPKPLSQTNPLLVRPPPSMIRSIYGGIDFRSKNLRAFVEKAMADHKVFSCVGVYPAIKNALKKRGWIEKTGPINVIRNSVAPLPYRFEGATEEESDAAWIARTLRDYPPDFIWLIRRDNIDWKLMTRDQLINRYPKAWFTTKVGLCGCLQNMHWFSEAGLSETFFPRCYRLCMDDEKLAFQEDYRLTACMSFCRHFVETYENKGPAFLVDPSSRITPLSIDFASRQMANYIRTRRHEDIDWLLPPNQTVAHHWEAFLQQYITVVQDKKKIRFESLEGVKMKYDMAKKALQRMVPYWPQHHLDGVYNMWICKPGARSRGKGIVIMNSMEKIVDLLNHGNAREANWVVQKYMERPLLVYKTKFDMRQWFVITDWSPLTLWFYKESYIRFCTKPFVLEDFHESIHLCNNAIQCRYQNAPARDPGLPDENMWDSYTFQAYLKSVGKGDKWAKVYDGMKQAIIGVLLASQESIEARRGCFELYGADFMLSEDFNPWLIEINSCPCMASTTSITARMCAQCLEDCIKLVIDRRHNRNADTGMFEMVYRQPLSAVTVQQFTGHDLVISGKRVTRDVDWPASIGTRTTQIRRSSIIASNATQVSGSRAPVPSVTSPQDNLTFSDLLQKLRMKNTQLFQGYVTNSQAQTLAAVAGVDTQDKTLTGTLLSKMRAMNKAKEDNAQTENEVIPGMKKVYPVSQPSSSRYAALKDSSNGTLSHLSKYFEESSNTFANLVRIGKEISDENNKKQDIIAEIGAGPGASLRRPLTFGPDKFGPSLVRPGITNPSGNPYTPRGESAKTLEEARNAANGNVTERYNGKEGDNIDLVAEARSPNVNLLTSDGDNDSAEKVNCDDTLSNTDSHSLLINEIDIGTLRVTTPILNLTLALFEPDSGIDCPKTRPSSEQKQEKFETVCSDSHSTGNPKPISPQLMCNALPDADPDPSDLDPPSIPEPFASSPDHTLPPSTDLQPQLGDDKINVDLATFELDIIDLTSADLTMTPPVPNNEPCDPIPVIPEMTSSSSEGNFYIEIQDILNNNLEFPSFTSSSTSNSDSEFDDDDPPPIFNFNPDLFLSTPRFQGGVVDNNTPNRTCSRRRLLSHPSPQLPPSKQKLRQINRGRKFPCHRVSFLRPCRDNSSNSSGGTSSAPSKKCMPTFPVSKINLKLV